MRITKNGFYIKAGMFRLFYFNGNGGWRGLRIHICPKSALMQEYLGYKRKVIEI